MSWLVIIWVAAIAVVMFAGAVICTKLDWLNLATGFVCGGLFCGIYLIAYSLAGVAT